ncbi:hypothetical protein EV363DRAFT_1158556, partial [Boletus edulis]
KNILDGIDVGENTSSECRPPHQTEFVPLPSWHSPSRSCTGPSTSHAHVEAPAHGGHSWPLFFLLSDFCVFEPKISRMCVRRAAPVAAIVLPVCYASFIDYCATFNGSCAFSCRLRS